MAGLCGFATDFMAVATAIPVISPAIRAGRDAYWRRRGIVEQTADFVGDGLRGVAHPRADACLAYALSRTFVVGRQSAPNSPCGTSA